MKNKSKLIIFIWWTILLFVLVILFLFVSMILFSYLDFKAINWDNMLNAFNANKKQITLITILLPLLIECSLLIYYYFFIKKDKSKPNIKKAITSEYGNSTFLANEKESNNLLNFEKHFKNINNECGWVVKSQYDPKTNHTTNWISSCKGNGHHCLVIGATASGKTQKTILQSIAYNAKIANYDEKPSMVIFDPKGEIANKECDLLKQNGYKILLFNLRNTFKSSCWNPLALATKSYFDAKLLETKTKEQEKEIEIKIQDLDNLHSSKKIDFNQYQTSKNDLLNQKNEITKQHADAIKGYSLTNEIITDIANALYTDKDAKDKFWQSNAISAFLSIYYLIIETIEDQYITNIPYNSIDINALVEAYNKVNLPTLAKEMSNVKGIKSYFAYVDNLEDQNKQIELKCRKSYECGSTVFNSGANTLGSIMATVAVGLEQYKQQTIQNITTTNEINLKELATKKEPVALFIIAPDEKENSYKFATLLVDQIYKANVELASSLPNEKLERPLQFYLDEFGNIPTIPKFDTMITVSRSRGIYFCIAIQGFNQIDSKYGKDQAKVIIENMLLHIFVSSTDDATIKYYQTRGGVYTVLKSSASNQVNKNSSDGSLSTSIDKKELLNYDDIKNNPNDMLLIFYLGLDCAWIKTDPFWKCNDLVNYSSSYENFFNDVRIFDFKKYYYNLSENLYIYLEDNSEKDLKEFSINEDISEDKNNNKNIKNDKIEQDLKDKVDRFTSLVSDLEDQEN